MACDLIRTRSKSWLLATLAAVIFALSIPFAASIVRAADLGMQDYEVSGVQVHLLSVKRTSANSLTVKWQYRNTTSAPQKLGESFSGIGSSERFSLTSDFYVSDPSGAKYSVLMDPSHDPMASSHAGSKVVMLGPKQTMTVWAKVAGPPADVTKVTVYVPGCAPFEDVPIGS